MNKEKLLEIAEKIRNCRLCDLYKQATNPVPGEGNPESKIVFIGEAPGFHEDKQGKPFVGNAGKYLDLLLEKAGLSRTDVFITNVVKHRPPENRDPTPLEVASCNGWLEQQLAIISPRVIVTLGRWSLAKYAPKAKISRIHGKPLKVGNFVILPMYHPAAALRNQQVEKQLEEDFLRNKEILQKPQLADQLVEDKDREDQASQLPGQERLF